MKIRFAYTGFHESFKGPTIGVGRGGVGGVGGEEVGEGL